MYKAILFDLDGTLLDSVPIIVKCMVETLEPMAIYIDEPALRHTIGLPLIVQAHQFAPGREEEFVESYRAIYLDAVSRKQSLFPGTLDMLGRLRESGHLTGLVTSKNARGTTRAIRQTGLEGCFDCVITADDVQRFKPDPEPIQKAMELLKVAPAESVYVGDSAFDVDMAQRAGVATIGVTWGARLRDEMELICPSGVVDNWSEFLKLTIGSVEK